MTRIDLAAAAVLCSLIHIGCDDGTTQPFKGKQDGATSSGGSDSGSADATSTGGSSGSSSTGGGSGSSNTGGGSPGDAGSACGNVFGHTGDCKRCLETNCCTLGNACSKVANCGKLAACTRDCDAKGGTMAQVDQCRTTCAGQFLTPEIGQVYNPVVQCMAQSCLSQCPFHGP
jgi:hypothetical protein